MKKASFYIGLVILLLCSCKKKTAIENANQYPNKIVDLGLEKQYDSSKWTIYMLNITEDSIAYLHNDFSKEIDKQVNLASCELRFFELNQEDSIVSLSFFFYQDNIPVQLHRHFHNFHTVRFKGGELLDIGIGDVVYVKPKSLITEKRQQLFKTYLQNNRSILHEWLLKEENKKQFF